MAHNPQGPGPQGSNDPAGSTQMFRAFVDEQPPAARQQTVSKSGPSAGLILGIVLAVVVVAGVAWLAFK
ncbi:hypothetical protein [Streptomyces beihaiensis]|uniref:Uncharacterized protein n=1 Tax=Streptomyces beihaiensis TaxID=2984495 RepID=A0ABT3U1J5_9ACTN|nr:hypothetical protein [Streptomyces beihaiensis]MCX3063187.1 hypothetical protein [Streptomyces beihaiensis]